MSDDILSGVSPDELIQIPSFLSSDYGAAIAAACNSYQCTGGCQGEQYDPCDTLAMTCGNSQYDCGACQNGGEGCSTNEYGPCDSCQGYSQCTTCETTCMSTCERYSQGPSCGDACEYAIQESPIDVAYWSWTSSNGSASSAQTKIAYNAIRSHGPVENFSYLVWNDLVDKINEVKQYAGYEWNAYFDLYENTLMSEDDRKLTALRFNSARYNIGIHVSTGIEQVYRGDDVIGDYFITIADCINEFIDSLA